MAIQRLTIDGYGQVEINNCAFRRDGRIEAQCKPNATNFASAPVENGMLLAIDNDAREVGFVGSSNVLPVGLVYSAEHIYDERTPGLKNFKLNGSDDFLPRLGLLAVGDKFMTNCICYDTTTYTDDAALKTALTGSAKIYGTTGADGSIKIVASAPTSGVRLIVEKGISTMPDGQFGVKFQVIGL